MKTLLFIIIVAVFWVFIGFIISLIHIHRDKFALDKINKRLDEFIEKKKEEDNNVEKIITNHVISSESDKKKKHI